LEQAGRVHARLELSELFRLERPTRLETVWPDRRDRNLLIWRVRFAFLTTRDGLIGYGSSGRNQRLETSPESPLFVNAHARTSLD
jgi:hypothetical protein